LKRSTRGWWSELPRVTVPKRRGRTTAADIISSLHPARQDYLADFGDWSMPLPSIMETHNTFSGRLALRHLNHCQEMMAQALAGERDDDDDVYDAIVNYAAMGIFHLKAVLFVMAVLAEHGYDDDESSR
jgi:hypothetical protein